MLFIHLSFVLIDCELLGRGAVSVLSTATRACYQLEIMSWSISVRAIGSVPTFTPEHLCEYLSVLLLPGPPWGKEALLCSSHTRTQGDEMPGTVAEQGNPRNPKAQDCTQVTHLRHLCIDKPFTGGQQMWHKTYSGTWALLNWWAQQDTLGHPKYT